MAPPLWIFRTIWAMVPPLGGDFLGNKLQVIWARGRDTLFCECEKKFSQFFSKLAPPL